MTDEELEKLSDDYISSEGDAARANRELDRREEMRYREQDEKNRSRQFWINFGCMLASFAVALAVCFIGLPIALPYWIPRIEQFLHSLGY